MKKNLIFFICVCLALGMILLPWLSSVGELKHPHPDYISNPNLLDLLRIKIAAQDWMTVVFVLLTVCLPFITALEVLRQGKKRWMEQIATSLLTFGIIVFGFWSINVELLLNSGYGKLGWMISTGHSIYLVSIFFTIAGTIHSIWTKFETVTEMAVANSDVLKGRSQL